MAKTKAHVDYIFLALAMILLITGLVVMQSASVVLSFNRSGTNSYYFFHQVLYGGLIGLAIMFITSKINYHFWRKIIPVVLLVSLVLLALVKVPGLGLEANGASRWIAVGPIVIQPAEIAKLALIIYLAGWLTEKRKHLQHFTYGLLPALSIIGLMSLLILWQPDIGSMLVVAATGFIMLFAGGVPLKQLFVLLSISTALLFIIIKLEPYRMNRLIAFLDPEHDPLGIGYQIRQARLAIGSGGLWGFGYGGSRQKYNYLPEVMGDSIFAVAAEELGFVRILGIIVLMAAFIFRGIRISLRAPDQFGKMLTVGIITFFAVQTCINIGAIIGVLPLTGVPLPLFSYGSSSLVVSLAAIGIVLNISKNTA